MKKYQYNNEGYPVLVPKKLKNILINYLGVESEDISSETRFVEDLGCDSLDCVELIMNVEEEFGIMIPDDEAMKCYTVGNLAELVRDIEEDGRRK